MQQSLKLWTVCSRSCDIYRVAAWWIGSGVGGCHGCAAAGSSAVVGSQLGGQVASETGWGGTGVVDGGGGGRQ
ncbi:hypothetical protein RIF29_41074 [Crotalaria pallida]|uniref:Uncharacterized protein n=1 Tax=Crotalaria pallida TaxID=3830 RepID=A0AAN9E4D0_CROPI